MNRNKFVRVLTVFAFFSITVINLFAYDEERVRYILADLALGGPYGYYTNFPNDSNAREATLRWRNGIRVINADDFERKIVGNKGWTIVYYGTNDQIYGMHVKLTTDIQEFEAEAVSIDLSVPKPRIPSGISVKKSPDTEYDTFYNGHWRITKIGGCIVVEFSGKRDCTFHLLGSTIDRVSYCKINIWVNGNMFYPSLFIQENWDDYTIEKNNFSNGVNSIKLELVGETHLWIDRIDID